VDDARAGRLLAVLHEAGVLADAATPTRHWSDLEPAERDRLAPDAASLALQNFDLDPGTAALDRRRHAAVLVEGAGRVGAAAAALLAAAGVGHVAVRDDGPATPADAGPAGLPPTATGRRADAARAVLRRVAPSVTPALPRRRSLPDVVLIARTGSARPDTGDAWIRGDVPHLVATVRETTGVVGPFVIPGRSSCLRCADLQRRDRDPRWPAVAAQLTAASRDAACDVALATLVASLAALHVLCLLDGELPPSVGGTLEMRLPAGLTRRRAWQLHPACGCTWPRAS
jgi:hypothetical protein